MPALMMVFLFDWVWGVVVVIDAQCVLAAPKLRADNSLHISTLHISQANQSAAQAQDDGWHFACPPSGIGAFIASPAVALFLHPASFNRPLIKSDVSGAPRTQQPATVSRRPPAAPLPARSSFGARTR